jgi:FHA domain
LECELCKKPYPYEVQTPDGRLLNIIEYETPTASNYMVFESISTSVNKVIHVVQMTQNKLYIGRGKEADITMTSTSVSRQHAILFENDGKFYL